MYFNEKSNDTNVDNEFNKTNPFLDVKNTPKPLLIFIGVGGLILLIIIILLLIPRDDKIKYFLDLNGDTDIIVYSGYEYIENGYSAYDSDGNNYNDEVIIDSNIDYSKSGEYSIIYKFKDIEKKRTVTVVSSDEIKTLLVLNGSNPMVILLNSYYFLNEDIMDKDVASVVGKDYYVNGVRFKGVYNRDINSYKKFVEALGSESDSRNINSDKR